MATRVFTGWSRWVYAAKPNSWPKLLVPTALGQGLGAFVAGGVNGTALVFGVLFVLADLLYIVFLNDWADASVDRIKREMFPHGCSPKTIPDGILPRRALLLAGISAGILAIAVATAFEALLNRPGLSLSAVVALAVFWAYTLPPLRLNYRGGGEALEALGVGGVLPWLNAYAQSGLAWAPPYAVLIPFFTLSLASAIASGLADERSDLLGGKRTVANVFGNRSARRVIESLVILGGLGWATLSLWRTELPRAVLVLGAAVTLAFLPRMLARTASAVTDAFAEQGRYKLELHRAIWWSASLIAVSLAGMAQIS
jgi:1,4-dihydroxy-2-naphthoate octaprenyltransferase